MDEKMQILAGQVQALGDAVSDTYPTHFIDDPISAIEEMTVGRLTPVQTEIAGKPSTIISRPEHFKSVLVTNAEAYEKGDEQAVMRSLLGNGLVTSNGERWMASRTALRGFFSAKSLNTSMDRALAEINKAATVLAMNPGRRLSVHEFAGKMALRMTAAALFQRQLDHDEVSKVYDACSTAHHWLTMQLWQPEAAAKDDKGAARYASAVEDVREVIEDMPDDRGGILEALEPVRKQYGAQGVFDELLTLLVAGFETTATVSAYAIYALADRPDLWGWLREEGDALLDRALDEDASYIREAPRTRAFVNEALRLYPSAWWFARRAIADTEIDGVQVPAGESVVLCPWSLHRQPDLWADARSFHPARWTAGSPDKFSYLPFGVGARSCIGQHLALTEMTALISGLVSAFDLTPLTGSLQSHRPVGGITLGPSVKPMEVMVAVRSRAN